MVADLVWQPSLLKGLEVCTTRRQELGQGAWVDIASGWHAGADELFAGYPWFITMAREMGALDIPASSLPRSLSWPCR